MEVKKIHIGNEIKKVVKEKKLRNIDLAKKWDKSRQSVSDLFKRETIDVNTLLTISQILSYNFFELYTEQLPFYKRMENLKNEPIEATLQIKLRKDKKDQVLKLVFGENNLEILNK